MLTDFMLPVQKGGRGLLSVADVVQMEKYSISRYVGRNRELIMEKVRDHLFLMLVRT